MKSVVICPSYLFHDRFVSLHDAMYPCACSIREFKTFITKILKSVVKSRIQDEENPVVSSGNLGTVLELQILS